MGFEDDMHSKKYGINSLLKNSIQAVAVAAVGMQSLALSAQELNSEANRPQESKKNRNVIEEVLVTAQKRSENLQDVPISISALGEESIKDRQVEGMEDLAMQIPSLQYAQFSGVGVLSIRGVGFGFVSGGGENSIAVHYDGVYVSAPGAVTMLQEDMAGIEVLRGPQGTLYGRNATGGVINMISPKPAEEFGAGVSALTGSFSHESYSAYVSGPLLDSVRARLSVSKNQKDGHIKNLLRNEYVGGVDNESIRLGVDIDLSEALRVEIKGFKSDEDFEGPVSEPIYNSTTMMPAEDSDDAKPWRIRSDADYMSTRSLEGGLVKFMYDISDTLTLTSLTGYNVFESSMNWDGDGTSSPVFTGDVDNKKVQWTEELNLSGDTENSKWIIGLYYYQDKYDLSNIVHVAQSTEFSVVEFPDLLALSSARVDYPSNEKTVSKAIYGDITYDFSSDFRLYTGLRYTEDNKEFVQTVSTVLPGDVTSDSCRDLYQESEETAYTGRLGLQLDFNDTTTSYVQVASGYKGGGFAIDACGQKYLPEEIYSAEAGIKTTVLDDKLRLNSSIYSYDYKDLQYEEVVVPVVNVHNADAEIIGVEFELIALPFGGLQIDSQISLAKAEYTELNSADSANNDPNQDTDQSGNPVMRTPDWQGTLGLQYEFFLEGSEIYITPRFEGLWSAGYQMRVYNDPVDEQGEYRLYNAYLNIAAPNLSKSGALTFRAFTKNIGNTVVRGAIIDAQTYRMVSLASPRTYGFEISYDF
ncbi:TonB-dependent receptor [Spongiibacter sp. KMU-166]|uniref:TonB-dependent receptor n=1 Tax=Spongiibacter thalassae TaxID=2721624 RepID=A0ABX1GC47_9GAMM|nr:TonB-dependent receptor [Spongiibacter thalassae]NKI15834.1 TonB-dependent receptor [Spongiibacter thalassae]